MQLLFTILEKSTDATIRGNVIMALGDIAVCYNSLIDQNIAHLYRRLGDANVSVRKNALMVLTHLILNGMVKVKGQLGEMAKCLVDEDARVRDLSCLFFTELSAKDSAAIYNNLPDIISNLSSPDTGVGEALFRDIMAQLFSHIKKERQTENLVEKLCQRFRNCASERQARDLAYCLSFLSFTTEKPIKKLRELLPLYRDKLVYEEVFRCFEEILAKVRPVVLCC